MKSLFTERMDVEYVNMLTGEDFSSIKVANIDLIFWPVYSSISRGEDLVKRVGGGYNYFSQLRGSLEIWCNIQKNNISITERKKAKSNHNIKNIP